MTDKNSKTPFLLLILDGFGIRDSSEFNAITAAKTPVWDKLWAESHKTLLNASEGFVGLPQGQMGNSEVGHMHIGCGRLIEQDFSRISHAFQNGEIQHNEYVQEAFQLAQKNRGRIHVLGLLSPGGVHSHEDHIFDFIKLAAQSGCKEIFVHAFLDGRDTPPKSAKKSIEKLQALLKELGVGQIASLSGRYYAMDRDKRWERIAPAFEVLTQGTAKYAAEDPVQALEMAYERGESDEFVYPTKITGELNGRIEADDPVVFLNFRSDRARQISQKLVDGQYHLYTLTQYDQDLAAKCFFPPQSLKNSLGEYMSSLGKTQLRIAETEKYAHVTFFFNAGLEEPFEGEDRILIKSPNVATYDLKPEMSAYEITENLVSAIQSQKYDLIVANFANADMVGHTGIFEAAVKAVEALDECLGQVTEAIRSVGGHCLITADHGNLEKMYDEAHQQPHTAHTLEPVPLVYVGSKSIHFQDKIGSLADVAPSLLKLMDLPIPEEMSGSVLF